jgi:hypothetical protein
MAFAGVALAAKPTIVRSGDLVVALNGGVSPKKLPKRKAAPIKLNLAAGIRTASGAQPPVTKTVTLDFDKHGSVDPRGLPACRSGRIESTTTSQAKKACRKSIVGTGKTTVRVAFAESKPFTTTGPLVAFNGGGNGRRATMYIHAYVDGPAPTAIVTNVAIKRIHKGRFGTRAVARIPVVAGGSGALTKFKLNIKRTFRKKGKRKSYLVARCATGRFFAHGLIAFEDGSRLVGDVTRPCRQRG